MGVKKINNHFRVQGSIEIVLVDNVYIHFVA